MLNDQFVCAAYGPGGLALPLIRGSIWPGTCCVSVCNGVMARKLASVTEQP